MDSAGWVQPQGLNLHWSQHQEARDGSSSEPNSSETLQGE